MCHLMVAITGSQRSFYSYRRLAELSARSPCDVEMIPELWAELGVATLAKLRGMFAIATRTVLKRSSSWSVTLRDQAALLARDTRRALVGFGGAVAGPTGFCLPGQLSLSRGNGCASDSLNSKRNKGITKADAW